MKNPKKGVAAEICINQNNEVQALVLATSAVARKCNQLVVLNEPVRTLTST